MASSSEEAHESAVQQTPTQSVADKMQAPLSHPAPKNEEVLQEAYQVMSKLSDEEYGVLKEAIKEHGVLVPVEYDEQGHILDGYHRVKACRELGIKDWPSVIREGMTEPEKIEHAYRVNLVRRHLTKEQKQKQVLKLRQQGWTQQKIADVVGVSQKTVSNWQEQFSKTTKLPDAVTGLDGKAYPSTKTRQPQNQVAKQEEVPVDQGNQPKAEQTSSEMATIFTSTSRDREKALDAVKQVGKELPRKHVDARRLHRIKREKDAERRAEEALAEVDCAPGIELRNEDFRDLQVEQDSVDLVFTDPPYPKQDLPLWEELGRFAAKVLKPGRLLVAYSGAMYLPQILGMLSGHLEYVWLGGVVLPSANSRVFPRQVRQGIKPLLFFSKGTYEPKAWISDTAFSEGRQKEDHDWQQSLGPAEYYIKQLTSPGALVVDPFLGAGTTAVACKRIRRSFVGCDVDAKAYAAARERVASA